MKPVFETKRLKFREFTEGDIQNLFALDLDPEVMKYISEGKTATEDEVKSTLNRIITKSREWKVYGVWCAELKATGEFVGWFSLKPLPNTEEIEVGYRLLRKCWGQGFATEGAQVVFDYGRKTLGLKKIVAITHTQNEASKRVLTKIGFKKIDDRPYQSLTSSIQTVTWFEWVRS